MMLVVLQADHAVVGHAVKGDNMLVSLLLLHSMGAPAAPSITRSVASDPPVRVWFNSDGNYHLGDKQSLRSDRPRRASGRTARRRQRASTRPIPGRSDGDQPVRGGKKIRTEGARWPGGLRRRRHDRPRKPCSPRSPTRPSGSTIREERALDYNALGNQRDDPEGGLMGIVQRMQGAGNHFEYDVATYTVSSEPRYIGWVSPYGWPGWYDPWYGPRVGFRFGCVLRSGVCRSGALAPLAAWPRAGKGEGRGPLFFVLRGGS